MNKKLIFYLLLVFSLSMVFSNCSRTLHENQLQFGILAAQRDLWDEAIYRWKKVLLSNPQSAAAHNNLAVAYEKNGLLEEAKKEYEIALKLNPNNAHIKANYQNFTKHYELLEKDRYEKN